VSVVAENEMIGQMRKKGQQRNLLCCLGEKLFDSFEQIIQLERFVHADDLASLNFFPWQACADNDGWHMFHLFCRVEPVIEFYAIHSG